jgi:hypothetical protein
LNLLVGIDARRLWIALALPRNLSGLGNDQTASGCPLAVVGGCESLGYAIARTRPHASERRHHDAMGQCHGTKLEGGIELHEMTGRLEFV